MVKGILFDKDGTLFEFGATWNAWCLRVLDELAGEDTARRAALADAVHFDLNAGRFRPDSPVIAGTNRQAAEALSGAMPGTDLEALERFLARSAGEAVPVPPVPLEPLLDGLRGRGLALGVMTNDAEISAFAQLDTAGIRGRFDFIAGYDSGFGAKPDPDPLLAFCTRSGLDPSEVAMIGDSLHDLVAAERAGMIRVAVLTGPALEAELAGHADVVLPHVGHLPAWLDDRMRPA